MEYPVEQSLPTELASALLVRFGAVWCSAVRHRPVPCSNTVCSSVQAHTRLGSGVTRGDVGWGGVGVGGWGGHLLAERKDRLLEPWHIRVDERVLAEELQLRVRHELLKPEVRERGHHLFVDNRVQRSAR